jgi:diacylglycerol kinase family enzyme
MRVHSDKTMYVQIDGEAVVLEGTDYTFQCHHAAAKILVAP